MAERMLAKVFHAQYGVQSPHEQGWKISQDGKAFTIVSPEGMRACIHLGETFPGRGELSYAEGLYRVGDRVIETDQTHWIGYQARPVRGKDRFLIDRPGKPSIPIKMGETVNRLGSFSRGAHGLLMIGNKVVQEAEKLRELSLIVLDKVDGVGHLAYFNVLTSTDRTNPNGICGRLVRDARGARFLERGGDDGWYDTARFYDPSGNYLEGALRSLEDAERSAALDRQWTALVNEAKTLGLQPAELEEHDSLVAEREKQAGTWQRHRFVVANGQSWVHAMVAGQVAERGVG